MRNPFKGSLFAVHCIILSHVRTPLLFAVNQSKRLKFLQEHKFLTVEHCEKIMWSDESRFSVADGREWIGWKQIDGMDHGAWFCCGRYRLGPLIRVITYRSNVVDQVDPILLMTMATAKKKLHRDTVLVLWRNGYGNKREILPCLGDPLIHQFSIKLSICGMNSNRQLDPQHLISHNWTVPKTSRGVNTKKYWRQQV